MRPIKNMTSEMASTHNKLNANRCYINADDCEKAAKYLKACLELIEENKEKGNSFYYDHIEGLIVASIVSYSRAFRISKGANKSANIVKVDPDKVFDGDRNKIELHETMLKYRDKAVAHSDDEFYSTKLEEVKEDVSYRTGKTVDFVGSINAKLFLDIANKMCGYFRKRGHDYDIGA